MTKQTICLLLEGIDKRSLIKVPLDGSTIIDAVSFAILNELVARTELGNFTLSAKGYGLLAGTISWESLQQHT